MSIYSSRYVALWSAMVFSAIGGFAADAVAADLSGSWSGYWISDTTGHKGPLRCRMTQASPSSYRAHFSGRFFKLIPFHFTVELDVVQDGETVTLSGEQVLGRRLGTFTYSATADCAEFNASYSSCKDDGRFVMKRCYVAESLRDSDS